MSSVIVKGMEMPECCDVCMFSDWSNLSQTASCKMKEYEPCFADFSNEYRSKRADFCPLIALPDHHGRLVDADALLDEIAVMPIDIGFGDVDRVEDIIRKMPTIVEAEGGT